MSYWICCDQSTNSYYAVLLAERRRSTPAPKEEEKVNEEQWPLREVVFVEDVKNVPVGKVSASDIWRYIEDHNILE